MQGGGCLWGEHGGVWQLLLTPPPQRRCVRGGLRADGGLGCVGVELWGGGWMSSGDHEVLAERFASDASKWAALQGVPDSAAAAGVVADIVLIDDHDDTSRVEVSESDVSRKIVFQSHLKICRLTRLEDGKYSLASVSPSVPVVTNESDASACTPDPDHC